MSDSRRRSRRDIDISRSVGPQWLKPNVNWVLWFIVFLLVFVIYTLADTGWTLVWLLPMVFGGAVFLVAAWVAWVFVVRRGALTWLRLAQAPARAMARGDAAQAERALQKALERARRFQATDHRRGLMLVELAMYVKNQGRAAEAKVLFEESVDILARYQRQNPMDYFIALNNYAIYFIHLRDHESAQRILEKVLDLTLVTRKQEDRVGVLQKQMKAIEFLLHMNLVFLFIEMWELTEARHHLDEADAIFPDMNKNSLARWHDHYMAIRSILMYASGNFADAGKEIARAKDPEYYACLRARTKLCLVRQEFGQAEQLMRRYFAEERKRGTLHRPELRDATMDLAESLFGQGKHDDAFVSVQEARSLVADFALPPDARWRKTLDTWLRRARELGKADAVAALEAELRKMPSLSNQTITILEKFRIHPQAAE